MRDCEAAPFQLKVFQNKPPMAILCRRFTAKEHGRRSKESTINLVFNFPFGHEFYKTLLIVFPSTLSLFIRIKDVFCGGKKRFVKILSRTNFFEEKRKVVALSKTSELRRIVETNV